MTHEDFYIIQPLFGPQHMYCEFAEPRKYSSDELWQFVKGGKYAVSFPNRFIVGGGRYKHEIMRCSPNLIFISDNVKREFKLSGVTGAEYVPITIENKQGKVYNDYYAMLITGRASKADQLSANSRFFSQNGRVACWHDVGYFFPIDSWDGSDIFLCSDETQYFYVCITEKVNSILKKYSSAVFIEKCSEFVWASCKKISEDQDIFDPNLDFEAESGSYLSAFGE